MRVRRENSEYSLTHTTNINTKGVNRVRTSLKYYWDLEKNLMQHFRALFDSATLLRSCLARDKTINKGRKKKNPPMPFGERERGTGRNSDYCCDVFGSTELNHFHLLAYKEKEDIRKVLSDSYNPKKT